jgi:hypothetical protein
MNDEQIANAEIGKSYRVMKKPVEVQAYKTAAPCQIVTLEGVMHANAGDWIITGVKGERYPCRADIFEETYNILGQVTDS